MSYSNDWSISGTSAISSLKDCYQWNGEKRLYDFGMLRLKDDVTTDSRNISVLTANVPLYVQGTSIISGGSNHGKFSYYSIPNYLVANKNLCALGTPNTGTTEDSYNFSSLSYGGGTVTNAKNWRYRLYPSIISFLENFSDFSRSSYSISDVTKFDHGYFGTSTQWIAQVVDEPSNDRFIVASCSAKVVNNTSDSGVNIRWVRNYGGDPDYVEWEATFNFAFDVSTQNFIFTNLSGSTFSDDGLRNGLFWLNSFEFSRTSHSSGSSSEQIGPSDVGVELVSEVDQTSTLWLRGSLYLPYYLSVWSNWNMSISANVSAISNSIKARTTNTLQFNVPATTYDDSSIRSLNFGYSGHSFSDVKYNQNSWKIQLGRALGIGSVNTQYYCFGDTSGWYSLNSPSRSDYKCPFILSREPALIFEPSIDSRNRNSTCYRVYKGPFAANVQNTGGTITFFAYIYGNPEQVSLTLSSDSGTTSTMLSNGGRIYWDGVSHGQVTDGCLVYEEPGATWGYWEGFGSVVNLAPIHGANPWGSVGGIYVESTGSSSTDSYYYYIDFPRGFITSYSGYRINNFIRTNISDTVSSSAVRENVYSTEIQYDDVQYIEVTAVGIDGNTKTMTYGSLPGSPTFRQTTIGGGSNVRFGWNPPSGYTIYGIMTLIVSIDGVQSTYTDSSAVSISSYHYKQYVVMTPTGDRDVECLYSELRWGGDADHLDYVATWGTRP